MIKKLNIFLLVCLFFVASHHAAGEKEKVINAMHNISSHTLFHYVKELSRCEYNGRLGGTPGYNKSAEWVISLFKKWGVKPAVNGNSFLQEFKNPYTLIYPGSTLYLHVPTGKKGLIKKEYIYEKDFHPGATSGNGELSARVVYVGYGITAPELGYDDYKRVNVKGKIVMMEPEVPVSTRKPELFKKWRPYSFHQYKVKNAFDHGAAGMLYNYHIANPNCTYIKDFLLSYVGETVIKDIFAGTGRNYKKVVNKIKSTLKPQSFYTRKTVTIKNITRHFPDATTFNVIGIIEGKDPRLKKEAVIIGAHLDHLGRNYELMPGANDNCSGVAVVLGTAKAVSEAKIPLKRSLIFLLFGAEEQGVVGSKYYLENPVLPNKKIIGFLNYDGVGRGTKIFGLAGKNYPALWKPIKEANDQYIHRTLIAGFFSNIARPRLDAARFMWRNIPSISFGTFGAKPLPYSIYHKTKDAPDIITPEIMEDITRLTFLAAIKLANR
jgi:hypothetical protein